MSTRTKKPNASRTSHAITKQTVEEKKYPVEEFFDEKGQKQVDPVIKIKSVKQFHRLNFRRFPSKDGEVLAVLNPGDLMEVLEDGKDWTKVKINDKEGYVMTEFIE